MKIGDIIWIRSTDWAGSLFDEKVIVGETDRSWLVMSNRIEDSWALTSQWAIKKADKVPKTLKGFEIGSEQLAKEKRWAMSNRYKISRRVERLENPVLLIKIAELIGYKEEE